METYRNLRGRADSPYGSPYGETKKLEDVATYKVGARVKPHFSCGFCGKKFWSRRQRNHHTNLCRC